MAALQNCICHCEIFQTLDDFHHAGATQAVAAAVAERKWELVHAFVNLDAVKQREFAEVGVLAALDFLAGIQEFYGRHDPALYIERPLGLQSE